VGTDTYVPLHFNLPAGWALALGWVVLSCLLCLTVVGIPFGIAGFRIANYTAWPLGRSIIDARLIGETPMPGSSLGNLLWIILAGLWLALAHIVMGISACLTIVGIPFGIIHFKLAQVAFAPLGKRIVSVETAQRARFSR
jgi:uncharacterized membrane protein YccF (DUF307 family)